mmetsp:Transcript_19574/g.28603  ORF Transcript_19574/g.28603 Transcript_19574/m.28603 type:complete len:186 (+) Transcript_19574:78-635(+)
MSNKMYLTLKLSGRNMINTDGGWFGVSDPVYEFKKEDPRMNDWTVTHTSIPIMNNLNPDWPVETIDVGTLCSHLDDDIAISFTDWSRRGVEHYKYMGTCDTSINGLLSAAQTSSHLKIKDDAEEITGYVFVQMAELSEASEPARHNPPDNPQAPNGPMDAFVNGILGQVGETGVEQVFGLIFGDD